FVVFAGKYTFGISSDDSSELWLSSNESPSRVQLVAWVGNRTLLSGSFHSKIAQFTKYERQLSHPVFLRGGQKYFIEVLHKQGRMEDHVLVGWKTPGVDHFRHLSGKSISLFINDVKAPKDVSVYAKFIPQDLPSHSHVDKPPSIKSDHDISKFGSDDPRDKTHALKFVDERDIASLFPSCPYNPSYLVDFRLNRYDGVNLIHDTAVYPADNTELIHMKRYDSCVWRRLKDSHGNNLASLAPLLNSKLSLYENGSIAVFHQHKGYLPLLFARTEEERKRLSDQLLERQMDMTETEKRSQRGGEDAAKPASTTVVSDLSLSLTQKNEFEIKRKAKRKNYSLKRAKSSNFNNHKVDSDKYASSNERKKLKKDMQTKSNGKSMHYNDKGAQGRSTGASSHEFVDSSNSTAIPNKSRRKLLSIQNVENVSARRDRRPESRNSRSASNYQRRSGASSRRQWQHRFTPIDKRDDMLTRMNAAREFVRKMARAVERYNHYVNKSVLEEAVYRRYGVRLDVPNIVRIPDYNDWIFHQNSSKCSSDGNLLLNKDVSIPNSYGSCKLFSYNILRTSKCPNKCFLSRDSASLTTTRPNKNDAQVGTPRIGTHPQSSIGSLRSRDETCLDISPRKKTLCLHNDNVINNNNNINNRLQSFAIFTRTTQLLPVMLFHVLACLLSLLKQEGCKCIVAKSFSFCFAVKNQGKWVQHFISNMEELYSERKDPHINVIIVDFSSTDIDVTAALKRSTLKRYQVRKLKGLFQRAYGIQAGAALVKNPRDIIFMCDLHLQIPSNIVDIIRKHCILGKMAFAPIVERLHCGFSPSLPFGFWELQGYGLFAMYKSDFTRVGGMNFKEFRTTWGGEDWELLDRVLLSKIEVERLRVEKFYHYYHSKMGMWGTRNMFNANDRDMSDEFDGDIDIIKLYNETSETEKRLHQYSRR
ncbi:PREDICTED: uncharacterized protein LOC107334204, partial [Acropora digitifera]|uniref:uncharacterized protein LOC107334204 n=1 Tax=Acropora digitifera TaxID=70779 RepID=UPI00077ADEB1